MLLSSCSFFQASFVIFLMMCTVAREPLKEHIRGDLLQPQFANKVFFCVIFIPALGVNVVVLFHCRNVRYNFKVKVFRNDYRFVLECRTHVCWTRATPYVLHNINSFHKTIAK